MAYKKSNPNGQAASASSEPVVLSTEQEAKIDLLATKAKQDLLLAELQLKADLSETQPVSLATNTPTLQPSTNNIGDVDIASLPVDPTASGSITAISQSVALSLTGQSAANVQITGTWVGTLQFQGSLDGSTWNPINAVSSSTSAPQTTAIINGLYRLTPGGFQQFRVVSTAWTSGTATILMRASVAVSGVFANQVLPVTTPTPLFKGRAATFRTPGRAGTTGQNIMTIHNATASTVIVTVNKVVVDMYQTVVKAITVAPPNIRIWKVTVLPTNGTALTKNKIGGTTTSNASVTVLGDASADGTGSGTTLTTTRPAGTFIAQKYASRFITAAGYEVADTIEYLDGSTVTLSALEGLVIFLDYTLATQNPVTDMWAAVVEWSES